MNKEQLLEKLKQVYGIKDKVVILASGALVLDDIVDEANDIDLMTNDLDLYNGLKWKENIGLSGRRTKFMNGFEIGYGIDEIDCKETEDGWRYQTPESALAFKFKYIEDLNNRALSGNSEVQKVLVDKMMKYLNAVLSYAEKTGRENIKQETEKSIHDACVKINKMTQKYNIRFCGRTKK